MSRQHADGINLPIGGGGIPFAYTPAIGWPGNTIGSVVAQALKEPGKLTIWGTFSETAGVANAVLTIPLPSGYTVFYPTATNHVVGTTLRTSTSSNLDPPLLATNGGTSVFTVAANGIVAPWSFFAVVPTST